MRYPSPGHHRSLAELRAHLHGIDPTFDGDDQLRGAAGPFGAAVEVFGRTLPNRFACHPMEGWDATADGMPTELVLRRWRNFGRSGAGLIWGGEAFAVQRDGRANPSQLYLEPQAPTVRGLAQLLAAVHGGAGDAGLEPPMVGLQLTHSGRFARPDGPLAPRTAFHHPLLAAKYPLPPDLVPLTDGELEGIGQSFVRAARLAAEAGFAFVDVKCCHGYLLHELLAARDRPGPYGGDFEGRTRLFGRIVEGIRTACPGLGIAVRVSLADTVPFEQDPETGIGRPMQTALPYRWGFGVDQSAPTRFDLTEPLAFLRLLRHLGIPLVNVSLGSPYSNPHLQRPAAWPPSDGYQPPFDPMAMVFEHLRAVRAAKAAVPSLLLVGTAYTYLQEWFGHIAQRELGQGHVDFIGLGRMLLSYPELPRDLLAGADLQKKRLCRTFSDCTTAPRNGMVSGCYPLDPHYKQRPEAARVKAINRERRQ